MVNDFIFDSACEKQDAEKIIDLLKEAMMNKPFPKKMDLIDLKNWTLENAINFPSFEKFTLVTATGKMERKQIHIIESIKTQMAQFGIEIKKTKY